MAETIRVISNLNDTLPVAPTGNDNIKWQIDRTVSPPNISAYVPHFSAFLISEVLTDGDENIIFCNGDVVMVLY